MVAFLEFGEQVFILFEKKILFSLNKIVFWENATEMLLPLLGLRRTLITYILKLIISITNVAEDS